MKRISITLFVAALLVVTGQVAAESPQTPPSQKADEATIESPRRPAERQPPELVYRPSEKISADSTVAFPVDI